VQRTCGAGRQCGGGGRTGVGRQRRKAHATKVGCGALCRIWQGCGAAMNARPSLWPCVAPGPDSSWCSEQGVVIRPGAQSKGWW
jgi:hypothetical protein